jgi:hypothetical protein
MIDVSHLDLRTYVVDTQQRLILGGEIFTKAWRFFHRSMAGFEGAIGDNPSVDIDSHIGKH